MLFQFGLGRGMLRGSIVHSVLNSWKSEDSFDHLGLTNDEQKEKMEFRVEFFVLYMIIF